MNYNDAVKRYEAEKTPEVLSEVTQALCNEMTVGEKLKMLSGHAMKATVVNTLTHMRYYNATPYGAGGCKRLGIPEVLFTDGPRGIVMGHGTCFPVSMLRGAAFDDELEYRVGEAMAREAIAGGANYFAGICINLLRNPLWGRAQETYGEDPFLLGKMGAALTKAMQNSGVIACPKHYALNSIEDLRFSVNAKASERTLHEVYFPHFKKCIDAGALSIMGAYNRVNGVYSCESHYLLTEVLRDTWGFEGFTISDFVFGVYSCVRSVKAGLDIEMPYTYRYSVIGSALKNGKITTDEVDTSVKRILSSLIRTLPKQKEYTKDVIVCKEHTDLSREVAEKGTVLLKNDGILPLAPGTKFAVVGRYANKINVGDHGSSNVYSPYTVTPYEGLAAAFGEENVSLYCGDDTASAVLAAKACDIVLVCAGSDYRDEGEFLVNVGKVNKKPKHMGGDRISARLPEADIAIIRALARSGKKVIVNIMGGSAYVIKEWIDDVGAVLMSFYSGLEGGNALASIVSGKVNPSGRLPFTIAEDEKDYPPFLYIGDNAYDIDYDYYHGYTLFEKTGKPVHFPFGYGLSYTSFKFSALKAEVADERIKVSVEVKNSGKQDGAAVTQIYIGSNGAADGSDRPVKLLKGFAKTKLAAGESKQVSIDIPFEDISFYDENTKQWVLDSVYTVFAGADCINANKLKKSIKL